MPRCPPSPGSKGRADRPARQQETSMRQFEQDRLELGRRVACSLHYQHPRKLRLVQATPAEQRVVPEPRQPCATIQGFRGGRLDA